LFYYDLKFINDHSMYNSFERPYVLSIAGLDPTAGAGILADVKTFEATGSYGFAVATCLTAQTEDICYHIQWLSFKEISEQIKPLLENYPVRFVKIGAVKDLSMAAQIMDYVKSLQPDIRFVWDPILIASSGKEFMKMDGEIKDLLSGVYLLTPNMPEVKMITGDENELEGALVLSMHTNVFLKGGHSNEEYVTDRLFSMGEIIEFRKERNEVSKKHGSGCVLSSAITSYLAQGNTVQEACEKGSFYMNAFFASSPTKLGIH